VQVLLLSDVLCTSWHANEMGNVEAGQTVCVWGLGPIGLMTLAWYVMRPSDDVRLLGAYCLRSYNLLVLFTGPSFEELHD